MLVGSSIMIHSGKGRIRLEEELKHLREKDTLRENLPGEKRTIEGILEGSPIPAFVIGKDHKVMFWNRSCTELTDSKLKEMIGTDHHYLPFYSEKRPMVVDLIVDRNFGDLERYYRKKSVQQSSIIEGAWEASDYYENLGGKPRHLYFLAAPIIDENGEIIAAIETLQD